MTIIFLLLFYFAVGIAGFALGHRSSKRRVNSELLSAPHIAAMVLLERVHREIDSFDQIMPDTRREINRWADSR